MEALGARRLRWDVEGVQPPVPQLARHRGAPDFRPDAAKAEKDLYALNGRLWCFYGAVHNATRALGEAIRLDPTNFRTMVLLAKIQIGRGRHVEALEALDAAAALEERHWQVHLLRLHCLRRLGRLAEPEAEPSHRVVCGTLGAACASVGLRARAAALCPPAACASSLTTPSTRKRRWRRRRDARPRWRRQKRDGRRQPRR